MRAIQPQICDLVHFGDGDGLIFPPLNKLLTQTK